MKESLALISCLLLAGSMASAQPDQPTMLVIAGAPGEEAYAKPLAQGVEAITSACAKAGVTTINIGLKPSETNDLLQIRETLKNEAAKEGGPLWIVMLGHGTWDGREAKFNLRGDDLSASDLAAWIKPVRRLAILVNLSASSGPFLQKISGPNRIVITATRSGSEQNYAHFGEYFVKALTDPSADLDRDGQSSLLEAFLSASRKTSEFFESEGRLATEHALLDDNGDGLGTQADWFKGLRVVRKSQDGQAPDGLRAHQIHLIPSASERKLSAAQRATRDALEVSLARLRERKAEMSEKDYLARLEELLLKIALVYQSGHIPSE